MPQWYSVQRTVAVSDKSVWQVKFTTPKPLYALRQKTTYPLNRTMCAPQSQVSIIWRQDKALPNARNWTAPDMLNQEPGHCTDYSSLTPKSERTCNSADTWTTKAAHTVHGVHLMSFYKSLNKQFKAGHTIHYVGTKCACTLYNMTSEAPGYKWWAN
jgi:hypothetical protein